VSPRPPVDNRVRGMIKHLSKDKGFGFIRGTDNVEYFFHKSDTLHYDRMTEGAVVSFVPVEGQKGPRAQEVALV